MRPADLAVSATARGVRVDLRVMPRAPRTALEGIRHGRLVIRVTAPPVDDAANQAAVKVLAHALGLSRSSLRIVSGATGRNKTVEVSGVSLTEIRNRLDDLKLAIDD